MEPFRFQDVIDALIQRESRGDPSAVSPKGAVGLMQIMPQHAGDLYGHSAPSIFDLAREQGFDVPDESVATARGLLMDPVLNYGLGDPYLRDLVRTFDGNLDLALTAYNAGPDAVQKMRASGGSISDFGKEAREYAGHVRDLYRAATGREMPQTMDTMQLTRPRARPVGLLGDM